MNDNPIIDFLQKNCSLCEYLFTHCFVPLIPFFVAYLVYKLGRKAYYQQKEYELIIDRYLKEGIDAISKNADQSLAVFRHNWSHCLALLKNFRDLGIDMNKDLYQEGLIAPNPSQFDLWRDYRLKDIIDDKIFNTTHQSLDAFIKNSYAFFKHDLSHGIKITIEGGKDLEVTASHETIHKEFSEELEKWHKDSLKYYSIIGELQILSSIIQTERLDFKKLSKFKNRKDVLSSVQKLKTLFPDKSQSTAN